MKKIKLYFHALSSQLYLVTSRAFSPAYYLISEFWQISMGLRLWNRPQVGHSRRVFTVTGGPIGCGCIWQEWAPGPALLRVGTHWSNQASYAVFLIPPLTLVIHFMMSFISSSYTSKKKLCYILYISFPHTTNNYFRVREHNGK